ncbi:hypothetical protein HOG98_08810 [bacterium]|jgi:hypothetical protein|nr:hypothetical protein [bacterium]
MKIRGLAAFSFYKSFLCRWLGAFFLILGLGSVFGLVYSVDPLFEHDQLTKFLPGLAKANIGFLSDDWISNLKLLYPLFTGLVFWFTKLFGTSSFYVVILFFMGLYFFFLLEIPRIGLTDLVSSSQEILKRDKIIRNGFKQWPWGWYKLIQNKGCVTCLALNSMILLILHSYYVRQDVSWGSPLHSFTWVRGMANQYIINSHFIPSSFGILFLAAIFFFLRRNYIGTSFCIAGAVSFHPAMMFVGVVFSLAFIVRQFTEGASLKSVALFAGGTLLLSLPAGAYSIWLVTSGPSELLNQSMEIYRQIRSPGTQLISEWMNTQGTVRLGLFFVAIILVRRTSLGFIMIMVFGVSFIFTLFHLVFDDMFFSMMTPWRVMAVLTPLSTGIIVFWCVRYFEQKFRENNFVLILSSAFLLLMTFFCLWMGVTRTFQHFSSKLNSDDFDRLTVYVREHKVKGDVYIIPPNKRYFRLHAQVPVFVDFKGFPTESWAVIEWNKRIHMVKRLYKNGIMDKELIHLFKGYPVTHVVLETKENGMESSDLLNLVYKNSTYALYRL